MKTTFAHGFGYYSSIITFDWINFCIDSVSWAPNGRDWDGCWRQFIRSLHLVYNQQRNGMPSFYVKKFRNEYFEALWHVDDIGEHLQIAQNTHWKTVDIRTRMRIFLHITDAHQDSNCTDKQNWTSRWATLRLLERGIIWDIPQMIGSARRNVRIVREEKQYATISVVFDDERTDWLSTKRTGDV